MIESSSCLLWWPSLWDESCFAVLNVVLEVGWSWFSALLGQTVMRFACKFTDSFPKDSGEICLQIPWVILSYVPQLTDSPSCLIWSMFLWDEAWFVLPCKYSWTELVFMAEIFAPTSIDCDEICLQILRVILKYVPQNSVPVAYSPGNGDFWSLRSLWYCFITICCCTKLLMGRWSCCLGLEFVLASLFQVSGTNSILVMMMFALC